MLIQGSYRDRAARESADAMFAISFPVTTGWNNTCDCGTYTIVHILKVIIAYVKNGGHKIDHDVSVD